jgi:hypothetical protein
VLGYGLTAKSAIKKELKEDMISKWTERCQSLVDFRQSKVWFPTPDLPKSDQLMKHAGSTVGRMIRLLTGFAFLLRQSTIIDQSRNPPLGDVSCRLCGEDDETPIHVICDCGHFISHRLNTIGVHQMPEKNSAWDMESMVRFLQLEEIILFEDC